MNKKDTKQEMQWPPLLNMSENRPWVDTSFRNVEKINAPYLNEMLQPVWTKNLGRSYIHDNAGNKYCIDDDGYFTRNDRRLFKVDNRKFVKEDVTEEFVLYNAYDESDDHKAYAIWNEDYNTFTLTLDNHTYTTNKLFDDGSIVATRIRVVGDKAVFVCYYDVDDAGYVFIDVLDTERQTQFNQTAEWYRQTIRRSGTATPVWERYTIVDADPVISISTVFENTIGISLVSSRNKCFNTTRNGFITYLVNNGEIKQIGKDILPTTATSTLTVDNVTNYSWSYLNTINSSASSSNCITSDGTTFYKYDTLNTVGEAITFPSGVIPTYSGSSVTIGGTQYLIYSYPSYRTSVVCKCGGGVGDDGNAVSWKFGVQLLNDTWTESASNTTIEKAVSLSYSSVYTDDAVAPNLLEIIKAVKVTWVRDNQTFEKTITLTAENAYYGRTEDSFTATTTVSASWLTSPNVVLDNGKLYSLWSLNRSYSGSGWANQTLTNGNIIQESGTISALDWDNNIYTITPVEYTTVTSNYNVARSNSFGIAQNFVTTTVKLNNASATASALMAGSGSESQSSKYLEYNNSNCSEIRYYPGTYNDTSFNYYGDQTSSDALKGNAEDQLIYTISGYRTEVENGSNWKLLYYVDSSNTLRLDGISWASGDSKMGTLLTPWMSIDENFYVVSTSDHVIYRDKSNRYYKISIEDGFELYSILDDRYLVISTTSYWNCYDSILNKKLHYATDFNDRVMWGQTPVPSAAQLMVGANTNGAISYARTTAQGINPLYNVMPRLGVTSSLLAPVIRSRVLVNAEKPFNCAVDESIDTQPISIFYGDLSDTKAYYKYDIYPFGVYDKKINSKYVDSLYSFSEAYLSPNLFTKYVNGAGNNDIVVEGYDAGVLTYDNMQPFLNYKASSLNTSYGTGQVAFFVLQGQFYAVMNEKIYSVVYNNGIISAQDAIIDIRGLKFVGNNPEIAFFFSPSKRMFYSFTGDAVLAAIYNASKLHDFTDTRYWYDEMTQTIYVAFKEGLLVFGQKNTYLFENWKNVTNVQVSTDGVTHITDGEVTYDLVYYEKEGYEVLPLKLETSFYGLGAGEYTAIDRWDIVLYNNNHKNETSWLKVRVRSLTNITEASDETTYTITPEMYDKWSYSYLRPYTPEIQKGVGLRLEIETPLTVARIVPHIMDMDTTMTNKRNEPETQTTVVRKTGEW